jgi:hypothetical protein
MFSTRNLNFTYGLPLVCLTLSLACGDNGAKGAQDGASPLSHPDAASDAATLPAATDAAEPKVDGAKVDAGAPAKPDADAATPGGAMDAVVPPVSDAGVQPGADTGPVAPHPSAMSVAVFDEASVLDFYLTFPAGEYEKLLTLMGPNETRWVLCGFRALGSAEVQANCRRKGDPLDWGIEHKPQIIVKFNHVNKQARFRGLRRLNLEAFDGAEAPIRDRVGMWVMREAGVDAPRVNHARVFKDGVYLGLYQNIETEDKEFLEDHFGVDSGGNLWESGSELKTNETLPVPSQLAALNALVDAEPLVGDHTAFYAKVDAFIDVDQILKEMAGETVLLADDNFSNGSSNFSLYEHPKRGVMILPWDFDSIITDAPATADLYNYLGVSSEANRLRLLMNQNPAWKQHYDDFLVEIRDRHLARVPAKVDEVCAQIASAVMTDPSRTSGLADFQQDCARVKAAALARVAAMKVALGR